MADRCPTFTGTAPGRLLTRRPGLPRPSPLRRRTPDAPDLGHVLRVRCQSLLGL